MSPRRANALSPLLKLILAERYDGVIRRMAQHLGVSPTRLGRVIAGGPDALRLKPENLLQLAAITDYPAEDLLRAAGKEKLLAVIQKLFGPAARTRVPKQTASEKRLVDAFRRLPRSQQDTLVDLLERAAQTRHE